MQLAKKLVNYKKKLLKRKKDCLNNLNNRKKLFLKLKKGLRK